MSKWVVLIEECDDPDLKEIRVSSDAQGEYCELVIDMAGRYGNIYLTEEEVTAMHNAIELRKQQVNSGQ